MYKFVTADKQKSYAKTDVTRKSKPLAESNQLSLECLRYASGMGARRDHSKPDAARYSGADRADSGAFRGQERQLPHAAGGVAQRKRQSPDPAFSERGAGNRIGSYRKEESNLMGERAAALTRARCGGQKVLRMNNPGAGVVQCTLWKYSGGRWNGISKFEEQALYPWPTNPVENMYFDDHTGQTALPGTDEYVDGFQSLLKRRAERAGEGVYHGRIDAFAQKPHKMNVRSPADPNGEKAKIYGLWGQYLVSTKGLGKRHGGRTGPPAYADFYDDVEYPDGTFTRLADDFLQPDGSPITPLPTELSDRARTRAAAAYAIQYAEEFRQRTGGTLPTMFFRAADKIGMKKAVEQYPFSWKGGTQQTRDLVSGKARFTRKQADMFYPLAPSSPKPQDRDDE